MAKKMNKKSSGQKHSGRKEQRYMENGKINQITTPINEDESLLKQVDCTFMVKHPPELLTFWRHAIKLDAKNPLDAFSELHSLSLAGPFLFLAHGRKKTKDDNENLFLNSRFATDLSKLETVLVHRGGRFCYWRDVLDQMPDILVHVADGDGEQHFPPVTICGERDLFAALQFLLPQQQITATKTKKQSNATSSSSGTKSDHLAHLFPDNYDMTKYGPDYLQMVKMTGIDTQSDKKVEPREENIYNKFRWIKLTLWIVFLLFSFFLLLWITFNPADKVIINNALYGVRIFTFLLAIYGVGTFLFLLYILYRNAKDMRSLAELYERSKKRRTRIKQILREANAIN